MDYRIPMIEPEQYQGGYHNIPVDKRHPLYHEPLLKLECFGIAYECYHAKTDGCNPPYYQAVAGSRQDVWLRKSAAEKLQEANQYLLPFSVELFVLDGYRPIECQRGLWNHYFQDAKQKAPNGQAQDWRKDALNHIADPGTFSEQDSSSWPAHTCGGSVDITLRNLKTATLLDMGAQFEAINSISYNDYFERQLELGNIDPCDRRLCNRRLLHWAMNKVGFTNDPFVFWHYDWGNQLYIKTKQALFDQSLDTAWYGYIASPPIE